jgi:GT2 family glycosyltransferase
LKATTEISYFIPQGVIAGKIKGRPTLHTRQNGVILVDQPVVSLWQRAEGETLAQILADSSGNDQEQQTIRAALACLCQAGLLCRLQDTPISPPPARCNGPLVSVIIVGHNSRSWLDACLSSLNDQSYTPLEIIFVDNASNDETLPWLTNSYPHLKTLRLESLQSLARAINLGVEQATGQYFLLLNPDVQLQEDSLAQMVEVGNHITHAIVVPKLHLMWAPGFLNGIGNSASPSRPGTDTALGHLDFGQFDALKEVASACFAAVLIARSAWEQVGPLDEAFEMYFEDIEWSYRARLQGLHIYLAPKAIVNHALGSRDGVTASRNLSPHKQRNTTYGQLRLFAKITGQAYAWYLIRNILFEVGGLVRSILHLDQAAIKARLQGWRDFSLELPALRPANRLLHTSRKLSDQQLFALQRSYPQPFVWHGLPELTWDLVAHHYLPILLSKKSRTVPEFNPSHLRLLIISHDIVAEKMAGPGVRYLEIARTLAAELQITLAIPSEISMQVPGVRLESYNFESSACLQQLAKDNDILLVSAYIIEKFPFLQNCSQRLVVDLYDPFVLENLYYYQKEPLAVQHNLNKHSVLLTNQLVQLGDFFACGNERQRDYWLGVLTANGRTNPKVFAQDDSLRSLIDVVGMGIPDRPPQAGSLLRGKHPLIPADARIVLWGGGIWDWLDPLTLVRAWPIVLAHYPEARLVFLGTRHPNPLVPQHSMVNRTEQLAAEIGEKDRTIIFIDWLSYSDREILLTEADAGVLMHPIHIETRYSIRTRVLDYLWARLPVLITCGDVTSEWVEQHNIGRVIPPFDETAAAEALCALLAQPKTAYEASFNAVHELYRWRRVVKPLLEYCLYGTPAPDQPRRTGAVAKYPLSKLPWHWRFSRAWYILRHEGLSPLLHRLGRYIQWRILR